MGYGEEKEIKELREYCRKIDTLVKQKGPKFEYCDARYKAAVIYKDNGYKALAYRQTLLAKNELHQIVKHSTKNISPNGKGFDLFELDDYCKEHEVETAENKLFWDLLYLESQDIFDSYLLYLEKDREPKDRFYYPKRDCLRKTGIVQGMQDLEDNVLNILTISMPPGTGKGQPLYSHVLTPDGFVEMRDIKVGSKVLTPVRGCLHKLKEETVLGVFPHENMDVYEITLESMSGKKLRCRCDISHIWRVSFDRPNTKDRHLCYSGGYNDYEDIEMSRMIEEFQSGRKIYIPTHDSMCFPLELVDIEYIGKEDTQCIYISGDDHLYITDNFIITHNTTLLKFFATWVMGKRPDSYSIFYSHSDDITRMFYDGVLDIIKSDEYKYSEIFPKVFIQNTNAKGQRINLNNYKPFESLQCTTVGAKNSGKVRVSPDGYLFCDDLIGGIEEALNKSRLDTVWAKYGTDARQRKKDGAKEIMIATRWSVHDCIGRLQLIYRTDPKVRFIAVPGINKETGKSNFEYKYDGFSVEFYEDQQKCMDDISYKCLYDNEPIEREGILYHADELRRYENLPNREPDAVYSIGDVKNKGTDFMVFPVIAQYGNDYYCVDCVCDDDPDFGIQQQKVASLFFRNKVQIAEFESNNGGDRFSSDVDEVLKKMGGFTHITSKFTESNKEARIFANAFWVKQNILFKKDILYGPKEDYGIMMAWLCRYSVVGKNEHDDVPDCFANIALYFQRGLQQATVTPVFNPFRMGSY